MLSPLNDQTKKMHICSLDSMLMNTRVSYAWPLISGHLNLKMNLLGYCETRPWDVKKVKWKHHVNLFSSLPTHSFLQTHWYTYMIEPLHCLLHKVQCLSELDCLLSILKKKFSLSEYRLQHRRILLQGHIGREQERCCKGFKKKVKYFVTLEFFEYEKTFTY